jgi:hypothetical protein
VAGRRAHRRTGRSRVTVRPADRRRLAWCPAEWDRLGCPYEAAVARADGDDPEQLRVALSDLHRLGARPAAEDVKLYEAGSSGNL